MQITYKRNNLTITEIWKTDVCPQELPKADLLRFCGCLPPVQNPKLRARAQNLVIDLTLGEDELLSQMRQDTRNQINRAKTKDSFEVQANYSCSSSDVDEFCEAYDSFASSRGITPAVRQRLQACAENQSLFLSSVSEPNGRKMARHVYFLSGDSVTLHYSVCDFRNEADREARNMMGRANRYLHWQDVLRFKEQGYATYDFGGVDVEEKSEQTSQITHFKTGFGGKVVPEYSATIPLTSKGRAALSVLRLRGIDF